jgi:hypothetical protein
LTADVIQQPGFALSERTAAAVAQVAAVRPPEYLDAD